MGCDPVHHNRMRCAWSTVRPRGREDREASGFIASGPAEVYNPVTQQRGAQSRKRSGGCNLTVCCTRSSLLGRSWRFRAGSWQDGRLALTADRIAASLVEAYDKDHARVVFIDTVEVLRENRFW